MKFAALSLPAHPTILLFIPLSVTMQKEKSIGAVATIERSYAISCRSKQFGII